MDYFKHLQELLKTELEADRQAYMNLTQRASAQARREAGLTWYPIAIRGTEPGRGDYLVVEAERTTHQDIPHQLRFGASARLFSNHDAQTDFVTGTLSFVGGSRLKITLRTEELPDWAMNGKLGIDLLFDEASYDEMEHALKDAAARADAPKEGRLVRILTGHDKPAFETTRGTQEIARLNASQRHAVQQILAARDMAIVHGPPGTGKTTTLVAAIKELYRRDGGPILVTAPSNTAVDLLSEKLSEEGLFVLRVGNPARVSERLLSLTLDGRMAAHPHMKEIKKLKKQAAEYRNMAHKYKRSFGKAERDQRKALFDEAHKMLKEAGNTEQYITDDLITKAAVVTATLVGAGHYTVRHIQYHTAVIDEAGQAFEPACWIPILKAQKVIFAGDHYQLPPTIKSPEAAKAGLNTTLLEKNTALYPEAVTLLEEQYRMHVTIMGYPSTVFYRDALRAHGSVAGHQLFPGDAPLAFIDTAGCGFEEKSEGTSIFNPEEASFLVKHLNMFANTLSDHYVPGQFPTVAVISPYKQQVTLLKELILHAPALTVYADSISVNTIDAFQGQERDMVYISMTRSNSEGTIGFLADTRRMNVAMTRARKKLVVIGDSATLSAHPFYRNFIAYTEANNAWQSAWEFMDS
jgi:cell division septum initiation protein DivIVA